MPNEANPKQPYPELFPKLATSLPYLEGSDKGFALSLHDYYVKHNVWSAKQAKWAQHMVEKAKVVIIPESATAGLAESFKKGGSLNLSIKMDTTALSKALQGVGEAAAKALGDLSSGVVGAMKPKTWALSHMLSHAAKTLKTPFIMVDVHGGGHNGIPQKIKVKKAKTGTHFNVVSEHGGYGNNIYYGKLTEQGQFLPHAKLTGSMNQHVLAAITLALEHFSSNPIKAAAAFGHAHGHCCFCNKVLTDPKSTSVGYGPVCAMNYQLPWGTTAAVALSPSDVVVDHVTPLVKPNIDWLKFQGGNNLQSINAGKAKFLKPLQAVDPFLFSTHNIKVPSQDETEWKRLSAEVDILF